MAMKRKEIGVVEFEVLRHRIEEIIQEMYYTMTILSGNTVVMEVGDHAEAILDASGETVMVGGGVAHWMIALETAAKYLVQNYEQNPGINEGDQFILNDPYIANVHAQDVQLLAPVFWEGKRIAWVATAAHMMDMGGMAPSSYCPDATEAYQEGLQFPGLKIMDKWVMRKDVENLIKTMTRTPEFNLLDIMAKIGSNNAAIARIHDTIKYWGLNTVLAFFEQLKDYSEGRARSKLSSLPDGSWSTAHYIESKTEPYLKMQITVVKEGDTLTFDFTGSSPASKGSQNVTEHGTHGHALCAYLTMLCYDIPWSAGVWRPVRWVIPEGTWVNPGYRAAVSYNCPSGAGIAIGAAVDALAQMLVCSEEYQKDAYTAAMTVGNGIVAGLTREKVPFAAILMEGGLCGMGAAPHWDGEDTGYSLWVPRALISNMETNELIFPLLYLFRRESCDEGGPGMYRGGVGLDEAIIPWKSPIETEFYISLGIGDTIRTNKGLAGGYPSCLTPQGVIENSDILEKFRRGEDVSSLDYIKGERRYTNTLSFRNLNVNDVLFFNGVAPGGGGFGDPVKRNIRFVLEDVKNGYVSIQGAKECYGVIIDPQKLNVHMRQTEKLRGEIISQRIRGGKL
jgi:N-methylhydantoinase B